MKIILIALLASLIAATTVTFSAENIVAVTAEQKTQLNQD